MIVALLASLIIQGQDAASAAARDAQVAATCSNMDTAARVACEAAIDAAGADETLFYGDDTLRSDDAQDGCVREGNTLQMNACAAEDLDIETARMEAYLNAALMQVVSEAEDMGDATDAAVLVEEIQLSQVAWQTYADQACAAVYTRWQAGTIRVMMAIGCHINLTRERSHHLWAEYLSFPDSTPPILPEPIMTVIEEERAAQEAQQ